MEQFHKYDAKIPFPFLFHSIQFPNPFVNIIALSFFPYHFFSISTLFPLHFASTNFFIHFHSISFPFPLYFHFIFIAKFLQKCSIPFPLKFHCNSIPFLLILILLIFPYIFFYHCTLIPFVFPKQYTLHQNFIRSVRFFVYSIPISDT